MSKDDTQHNGPNGTARFKNVNNGRESAVNRALDGSTYPGLKVVPSCHCKK
jgi:hypothetical protein